MQMLISLGVSLMTARYLGPEHFGLINYATTYVAFFYYIATLGIHSTLMKELVDEPEQQGITLGTTLLMQIISALISICVIIAAVSVIDREETTTVVVVGICSMSLVFWVFDSVRYWFQVRYRSKIPAMITLIGYIIVSLYRVVLLILKMDVRWFAAANALDYFVIAMLLLCAYRAEGGTALGVCWSRGLQILKRSYHFILSGLLVALYGHMDKIMLKQMLGDADVGYYSVATAICATWVFVLRAIMDAMTPTIMRCHGRDQRAYEKKNRQLYAIMFYISVIVSLVFQVLGSFVINVMYGRDYAPAVIPLKIVTWYTGFSYLGMARNAWITCEEKQKYLKYLYFSAAVINVCLNYLMIPLWGASGAALASLITQICTSIVLPLLIPALQPNAKLMLQAILLQDVF